MRLMPARIAVCTAADIECDLPAPRPPRNSQHHDRSGGGSCASRAAKTHSSAASSPSPRISSSASSGGLVASLNHPGGNVTGAVTLNVEVGPKRLELLHNVTPTVGIVGVLINPDRASAADDQLRALRAAAHALGEEIRIFRAETESDIDATFTQLAEQRAKGLFVTTDAFFF